MVPGAMQPALLPAAPGCSGSWSPLAMSSGGPGAEGQEGTCCVWWHRRAHQTEPVVTRAVPHKLALLLASRANSRAHFVLMNLQEHSSK